MLSKVSFNIVKCTIEHVKYHLGNINYALGCVNVPLEVLSLPSTCQMCISLYVKCALHAKSALGIYKVCFRSCVKLTFIYSY